MFASPISSDKLALRACRLFETGDLDDARARISTVMQPHGLQSTGGRMPGTGGRHSGRLHMDLLRLRHVSIGTIAFGRPAEIDVPPLDDYHLFVFCLTGSASLRIDDEEVEIDRLRGAVCASRQALAGQFSADCEQFVVRIERQRLAAFTGERHTRLRARADLRSAGLAPLVSTLRGLVTDESMVGLLRSDPAAAADYEQLLLRVLLRGQEDVGDAGSGERGARPAAVHRAIGYIEAHAAGPVSLEDIAGAAGVPERTLHEVFQRFEGISPMRHLRNVRLDRVRAELQRGVDVTGAALGAGFTHLGRFSQEYATRFGEKPSATRRR